VGWWSHPGTCHFHRNWSWNIFNSHSHCTSALVCTEFQFLAKVKATSTGKLLDNLPRKDAVAELFPGKFIVAYCNDPKWKPNTTTTFVGLIFFVCKYMYILYWAMFGNLCKFKGWTWLWSMLHIPYLPLFKILH
jgi:hypothetical protein